VYLLITGVLSVYQAIVATSPLVSGFNDSLPALLLTFFDFGHGVHLIPGAPLKFGTRGNFSRRLISGVLGLKVHLDVLNYMWRMNCHG